jgi:hypothetical protein
MRLFDIRLPLLILFACVLACGARDDLHVTSIQLGRAVNADRTVAGHTTRFKPTDSVYVSVLTMGSGSGTISVRWVYAGRVVGEPRKQVSYQDFAATDFRLESAGEFPAGDYAVEVFLDGRSTGTREFRVETLR